MTVHLSARLAWHDRGWDGRICDAPHLNAHCIVHQHIREGRDDTLERDSTGIELSNLENWLPPCSRDTAAFADRGFVIVHEDPLELRNLPSVSEEIPPYSCCTAPYRWMLEDFFQEVCEAEDLDIPGPGGLRSSVWVTEPYRQRTLLKSFFGKLEVKKSLVFYYVNQGNPIDESASRLIVGVGRIKEVAPQLYFPETSKHPEQHPVWSRRITQHYPDEGVRIPYQEYLKLGLPTEDIICKVPKNVVLPFSFGSEHISDDIAVAILERVIQSVEQVALDGHISNNWEKVLDWLNNVLAETWQERGAFPGVRSLLQYLGCSKGTAFQRAILLPMSQRGENPWDYTLSILNGKKKPVQIQYSKGLEIARERWNVLRDRHTLLSKLVRFELTQDQIRRISDPDSRMKCGINYSLAEIEANPYLICENDLGTSTSEPVGLETIDHGLRPEGNAAFFPNYEKLAQDDRRRVRAVGVEVLNEAAAEGDTLLEFSDFLKRIRDRFPDKRICEPDRDIVSAERDFYQATLRLNLDSDPQFVALSRIHALEERVRETIKRRAKKTNPERAPSINWRLALENEFGEPRSDRARLAHQQQEVALQKLFSRRLCVLTGSAGTGKTSVLKVFLNELERVEGRQDLLLLAPTGKARVRLSTTTERNAMTIHQFLLKQGWFMPDIFVLREHGTERSHPASIVVVDECSMIPIDLFGTLFRALDAGPLTRLILVGDPNQLPPIGPGRPFADIIEWLERENQNCIASLSVGMRVDEKDGSSKESVALTLAEGYRSSVVTPSDDEILSGVARGKSSGDLRVLYWEGHDDLRIKMKNAMSSLLSINDDFESFNASLGITAQDWKRSEDWQILSPTRVQHFGSTELNRLIQSEYKQGLIARSRDPRTKKFPRPFGDEEIVWTDKVIQTVNQSRKGWPRDSALNYVANGEIGVIQSTQKSKNGDFARVVFSTQPDVSYSYFRRQVEDELELAYAVTVHRAQGSDFGVVFLIIPQNAMSLSRELIYTALTRFRSKLVLLVEKDIETLRRLRSPESSDTKKRNTNMFKLALRLTDRHAPSIETLIHRTRNGTAVRSKSEVVVADILQSLDISYQYEKPLLSRTDPKDFRLPDFTVSFDGDIFYWEHLGMLRDPSYQDAWERKLKWYKDNGHDNQLITSQDSPNGGIDAAKIEEIARKHILGE